MLKRMARNRMGEISLSAPCTITKVEPQIMVLPASAASARQAPLGLPAGACDGRRIPSPSGVIRPQPATRGMDSGISQQEAERQKNTFQPQVAAVGVVPLFGGMSSAALAAGANRNRRDAQ